MRPPYTIGIDIGGTRVKLGLCDADGRILARDATPTDAAAGPSALVNRLKLLLPGLAAHAGISEGDMKAVGVGAPGPLDQVRGIVRDAPNLPGWRNVPLRELCENAFGRPARIENDANAAAFGEFVAGAGADYSSMVLLTLGTGLGSGIVLEGHLIRGEHGTAGECGHMIIEHDGRPCPCGQRGCLERYVSATAVVDRFSEAVRAGQASSLAKAVRENQPLKPEQIVAAAQAGDALAARIWDETCRYLAVACVNLMRLLDVECIALGGGVANAGERLIEPTLAHYKRLDWKMTEDRPLLRIASLGEDAGIVGAALLARELLTEGS